jgi:hypothetical protein
MDLLMDLDSSMYIGAVKEVLILIPTGIRMIFSWGWLKEDTISILNSVGWGLKYSKMVIYTLVSSKMGYSKAMAF